MSEWLKVLLACVAVWAAVRVHRWLTETVTPTPAPAPAPFDDVDELPVRPIPVRRWVDALTPGDLRSQPAVQQAEAVLAAGWDRYAAYYEPPAPSGR